MARLTGWAVDAWRRSRFSRRPRLSKLVCVSTRGGVPQPLPRRAIVLVGTPPKWAILACPCGTGHTIDLNLANLGAARWVVSAEAPATIHPSIDVQDPCGRCHFWVRRGRVDWVQSPRTL